MRKLTALLIISLFLVSPVFAETDIIGKSRISPASPLYFLKSVREILELKFADNPDIKSKFRLEFASRRIREVRSLVGTSHEDLIEPTLERYVSNLQELKGMVHPNNKEMVRTVNENIATQMNILQEVYKQASDPKAKRSIRLTIFRVSEQFAASRPVACNFLAKEASSSALTEIERYVLSQRALKCSESPI